MKIDICSDLHLEFSLIELNNEHKSDVLCLNGDICVLKHFYKFEDWFKRVSDVYENVLYIAGNHEFYDFSIEKGLEVARNIPNITFLEKDYVILNEVLFLGGTLWTNMNNQNPTDMISVERGMNDFRCIQYKDYLFSASDAIQIHTDTLQYFNSVLNDGKLENDYDKTVIMTHHAPSYRSVPDCYSRSHINAGYCSDLEEWMLKHDDKVITWFHGHIHEPKDYEVRNTRIICNPRGYSDHGWYRERCADEFKIKTIEL